MPARLSYTAYIVVAASRRAPKPPQPVPCSVRGMACKLLSMLRADTLTFVQVACTEHTLPIGHDEVHAPCTAAAEECAWQQQRSARDSPRSPSCVHAACLQISPWSSEWIVGGASWRTPSPAPAPAPPRVLELRSRHSGSTRRLASASRLCAPSRAAHARANKSLVASPPPIIPPSHHAFQHTSARLAHTSDLVSCSRMGMTLMAPMHHLAPRVTSFMLRGRGAHPLLQHS